METNRIYKYDNLKFVLIFFTVFAHFLELFVGKYKKILYILIYTFHMPLFAYISGYFSKGNRKTIIKLTGIYFVWQTVYFIIDKFALGMNIRLDYTYPNWILWYIFAMIIWNIIINLFKRVKISQCKFFIALSFVVSILIGFIDDVGYKYSASRIITFLPYFLTGYFNKKFDLCMFDFKKDGTINIKRLSCYFAIAILSVGYFVGINKIYEAWLFGAFSYHDGKYNFLFKSMWILLSLVEIYILTNIIPNKNIRIISTIGANTLNIYLMHGIVIKLIKEYSEYIFVTNEFLNLFISVIFTLIVLIIFGYNFMRKTNRT